MVGWLDRDYTPDARANQSYLSKLLWMASLPLLFQSTLPMKGATSLSTTPSGLLTEGSYTYAVDAGLRSVGAIDPDTGLPDARWLDEQTIQNALDYVEKQMLGQLQKDYAVEVDTRTGPYQQSLSQKREAITEMLGGAGGQGSGVVGGVVVMRELTHD